MILTPVQTIVTILMIALGTMLTRGLPFLIFKNTKKTPKLIAYFGRVLPYATIGMLVIYCLKGVKVMSYPYALPELIAVAAVVLLHNFKRNTLLSIGGGTLIYMILVRIF